MTVCLIDQCVQSVEARGLCHACYQSAWRYIKTGATTWEVLEVNGFALPTKSRGMEKGAFRKALEKEEPTELQVPISDPATIPLTGQQATFTVLDEFSVFEQGYYDPPDEAPTDCGPPEPDESSLKIIQDFVPIIKEMVPERVPTMSGFPAEPLSESETSLAEQAAVPPESEVIVHQKERINQIENFFRYLPDLHSGQESG